MVEYTTPTTWTICSSKYLADMYSIDYTNRFRKDLKRCVKRGIDIQLIRDAITLLAATGTQNRGSLITFK